MTDKSDLANNYGELALYCAMLKEIEMGLAAPAAKRFLSFVSSDDPIFQLIAASMTAKQVIELCLNALGEELSAWDIDPPLDHVLRAHAACEKWLEDGRRVDSSKSRVRSR